MTQDQIIQWAREAHCDIAWADSLQRFAALVAAHEREECAKVCDEASKRLVYQQGAQTKSTYEADLLERQASAIRARGNNG